MYTKRRDSPVKGLQPFEYSSPSYSHQDPLRRSFNFVPNRASNEENLNECIFNLRRYISEFNVMNLAKEKDPRLSPLPRDNKGMMLSRHRNRYARCLFLTVAYGDRWLLALCMNELPSCNQENTICKSMSCASVVHHDLFSI